MNSNPKKLVELGFIYALKNPINNEIFYIGATESSPKDRLQAHYYQFNEYLKNKRHKNKKFEYFEKLLPNKATVELLQIVQNDYLYAIEIEYIKKYKSLGYNLTNQTKGGYGGNTYELQDYVTKTIIAEKISKKNKGVPKPKYFAENLSKIRKGKNNPMCGTGIFETTVILNFNNEILNVVNYPFEIADFFDSYYGEEFHKKHAALVGGITKRLRISTSNIVTSKGFKFMYLKNCSKEIQDIVQIRLNKS